MSSESDLYAFPVPSAPPELPVPDVANLPAITAPPAPITSWIGWGLAVGTGGGALSGLIIGVVMAIASHSAEASVLLIVYGSVFGAILGFPYGLVVGCLQAIARRSTSGQPVETARVVHGLVGLAPLIVGVRTGTSGGALLFGVLPAVVGCVGSMLLVNRFRRVAARPPADSGGERWIENSTDEQHRA
jgi:hypothetical protein